MFRRHWYEVAEERLVTAVRLNEVPGTTVAVGPLMVAEKPDAGVVEAAPRVLPAEARMVLATLAVGRSSYE